jgi:hypothetical protein
MDVAVVGNLPHYIVDDELAVSIFLPRNQAERLDHEDPFVVSRSFAMFAQHRHRRIA